MKGVIEIMKIYLGRYLLSADPLFHVFASLKYFVIMRYDSFDRR